MEFIVGLLEVFGHCDEGLRLLLLTQLILLCILLIISNAKALKTLKITKA